MIKIDDVTKKIIKEHNLNWPQIPDHPYRILIIGGSPSEKTNALLNLIKKQNNDLYVKDPSEAKFQYVINKRENPR